MGLIGFICPFSGQEVPFSHCSTDCHIHCMSQPLLMALMREQREVDNTKFHVTELPTPEQIVYLKRTCDYYSHPFNLIWAVLGTAVHTIIEGQKDKVDPNRYDIECPFEVDFGYAKVTGRADIYDKEAKILYDYKTIKAYKAKRLLEGEWEGESYLWQLNMYKALHFKDAESLMIEAIIKDWSPKIQDEDNIHPIERIVVPMLKQSKVEKQIRDWLAIHVHNLSNATYKPCTKNDVWFQMNPRSKNYLVPLRCRDYCEVNKHCQQYRDYLNGVTDAEKSRVYPAR
jgi:hypothetical protein